jgi:hypothetical protein
MPDWTAPFKLPTWTDEQFEKQKTAYNKLHGYTVTIPALGDIVQLCPFSPLTADETKKWTGDYKVSEMPMHYLTAEEIDTWVKTKTGPAPASRTLNEEEQKQFKADQKADFPPDRLRDIITEKKRKADRFVSMLASPAPKVLRSAGSVMVSLDNAQDAISTGAVLGMIAGNVLGPTAAALLAGPTGMLAGAASLLSLINPMSYMKWPKGRTAAGRAAKRDLEKFSDKNPFSKKAKCKTTQKMKKFRPSMSNAIEALQVTQNIFGIGLCLGPIMGVVQDILSGVVRQWTGEQVDYKLATAKYSDEILLPHAPQPIKVLTPPPQPPGHVKAMHKALKMYNAAFAAPWHSDELEEAKLMIAANLALQAVTPYMQEWNPFDQIENLADVMIEADQPTDILTIEAIEESGYTLDEVCNWPQNGERWITLGDLQDVTSQQAADNLTQFGEENKNSELAYVAAQNAHDFALGSMEAIEGPGSVEIEYSQIERIVLTMLDNGWCYPAYITPAQIQQFEDWCIMHEERNWHPTAKTIMNYAQVHCGFTWAISQG